MKKILKIVGFCSFIFMQNSCIASDYEEEDTRTLEELEQCPCVQEYVFQKYGEDLTAPVKQQKKKKKRKKTKTQRSREFSRDSSYEDHENEYDQDQRSSSRSSSKDKSGTARSKDRQQQQRGSKGQQQVSQRQQQNRGRSSSSQTGSRSSSSDNSWMHETAWMNLKNPFTATSMLAQNDALLSKNSDDKSSIEVFKDLKIKARNTERPKYRINEKESIRFRQELEKYRQALA